MEDHLLAAAAARPFLPLVSLWDRSSLLLSNLSRLSSTRPLKCRPGRSFCYRAAAATAIRIWNDTLHVIVTSEGQIHEPFVPSDAGRLKSSNRENRILQGHRRLTLRRR